MDLQVDMAFSQGRSDALLGRPRSMNPYGPPRSPLEDMRSMAWTLGWLRGAHSLAKWAREPSGDSLQTKDFTQQPWR